MMNVKKIWNARNEILDGIKNSIFKTEAVEVIAEERLEICKGCTHYDVEGSGCLVPGTAPCCSECGCSLALKLRSLSSSCGIGQWNPVLTDEEDMNHEILNPDEDA